jgi:bifunctional non-homologous end joining protein LigD
MPSRKLAKYRAKRNFSKTAEPSGNEPQATAGHAYLIQKHAARRLHYDFRLELDGTLKSWAVTKGPSLNPTDKRLAVHVEDHPLAYGDFEGTIPKGEYGGGTVMLWDQGSWSPIGDAEKGYKKGKLDFELHGKCLKGRWHLVHMHGNRRGDEKRENWLLIKGKDQYANEADGDAALGNTSRASSPAEAWKAWLRANQKSGRTKVPKSRRRNQSKSKQSRHRSDPSRRRALSRLQNSSRRSSRLS